MTNQAKPAGRDRNKLMVHGTAQAVGWDVESNGRRNDENYRTIRESTVD